MDIQTQMEALMNANKIKYATLDRMCREVKLKGTINVYIDINSLLDILYRSNNLNNFHTIGKVDNLTISSQIINTVAHYRHYFYSRHQKSTIFYLLYTSDSPSKFYTNLCETYKSDFLNLRFNKKNTVTMNLQSNIESNVRFANIISQYVPDVYFVNTGRNDIGATIQYLIETDNLPSASHLIYTNDKVMYQLVNNQDTFIFLNKQDNSKFVTQGNLYEVLTKKDDIQIPSSLYKIVLAIAGNKKYNVNGVKGVQVLKALKILDKAMDSDIITDNDYNSITLILDNMISEGILKEEHREIIERNFKIFNYNIHVKTFTDVYLDRIDAQLINKTDYDQVMFLSNKYYKYQPIQFLELMETFNK